VGVENMTNDNRRAHMTQGFSAFEAILVVASCLVVCIVALSGSATYGQDVPSTEAQQLGMLRFVSAGPIQISLTDPEGNVVSRETNDIDGADFFDGDREVIIEIPHSIVGDYELHANVSGSANRLQRFDVSVTDGTQTLVLAERELIVNIPLDPYVIRNNPDGFAIAQVIIDDSQGASSGLIWLFAGGAVLLAGIAFLILKSRKRRH